MAKMKQTSAPGAAIISTADMKTHLRVTHSTDDDYIDALISCVTAFLDGYTGTIGRALITQTWTMKLDQFPASDEIVIPLPPLASVTHIKYYDTDNVEQTLSSSNYEVDLFSTPPRVVLANDQSWPSTYEKINAVEIVFVAGYGAAGSDIPQNIIHAAKLLVAHMYFNREAVAPVKLHRVPDAVQALLGPWRAGVYD